MEIQDYVRALRRHFVLILVFIGIGLALAQSSISRTHDTYASKQSILVTGSGPDSDLNRIAADRISSYLAVARSDLVTERVARALVGVPADADYSISADNPTGTSLIEITATARGPRLAKQVADETVSQVVAVVRELEANASAGGKPVTTLVPIGEASLPTSPNTPSAALILLLGAGIGLFFGVVAALLRYGLDQSLRGVDDAETRLGARVLGVVPRFRRPGGAYVVNDPRETEAAEAFRTIAARLRPRLSGIQHRVLVTSSVVGEGTSVVARNLAAALAESDVRTVLISPDDPQQERALASVGTPTAGRVGTPTAGRVGPPTPGMPGAHESPPVWHPSTAAEHLHVIASPNGALPMRDVDSADWVIETLAGISPQPNPGPDAVFIDAGAAAESAAPEILAKYCTDVLVVVEAESTQRTTVRRTLGIFSALGVPVAGLVLNSRHRPRRWPTQRRRRR